MDAYNTELAIAIKMGDNAQIAELEKEIADAKPTYDVLANIEKVLKCLNPLYGVSATTTTTIGSGEEMKQVVTMDNFSFYGGIASNLVYSTALFFGGACLFKKRDVK